jgi:hypothetical protein
MATPKDMDLYEDIKKEIYKKYPKHSAYRSGLLVKTYKEEFKEIYGNKQPYLGKKPKKQGLARWFDEEWVNQRGTVGYEKKGDLYRPSKRITKKTPTTWSELSDSEITSAKSQKKKTGRVKKFKK